MESQLIQLGALGIFCAWLMWRVETRLDAIREESRVSMAGMSESMDRLTRAQLLAVIGQGDVSAAVKRQARALLDELGPMDGAAKKPHVEVGR